MVRGVSEMCGQLSAGRMVLGPPGSFGTSATRADRPRVRSRDGNRLLGVTRMISGMRLLQMIFSGF